VPVVRYDGCVMSQRPTHDAGVSTSRAAPPAPDTDASQLEQGLHRLGVPHALFDKAQTE
jgi:hypothetical protein